MDRPRTARESPKGKEGTDWQKLLPGIPSTWAEKSIRSSTMGKVYFMDVEERKRVRVAEVPMPRQEDGELNLFTAEFPSNTTINSAIASLVPSSLGEEGRTRHSSSHGWRGKGACKHGQTISLKRRYKIGPDYVLILPVP